MRTHTRVKVYKRTNMDVIKATHNMINKQLVINIIQYKGRESGLMNNQLCIYKQSHLKLGGDKSAYGQQEQQEIKWSLSHIRNKKNKHNMDATIEQTLQVLYTQYIILRKAYSDELNKPEMQQ